jgi:rRNA pseudouridine-1189 N-methylase Emg1 (Nep1/Mra1 family)
MEDKNVLASVTKLVQLPKRRERIVGLMQNLVASKTWKAMMGGLLRLDWIANSPYTSMFRLLLR